MKIFKMNNMNKEIFQKGPLMAKEKIEEPKEVSSKFNKIKEMLEDSVSRNRLLQRFYPKEFNEIHSPFYDELRKIEKEYHKKFFKYGGILLAPSLCPGTLVPNWDAIEYVLGKEKAEELSKEAEKKYGREVEKFLREKPLEEIYERCKNIALNLSKEGRIESALGIARELLEEKDILEVLENVNIERPEQARTLFEDVRILLDRGEIKRISEKIYKLIHPFARQEIEDLIKRGEEGFDYAKRRALERAEFYEKKGVLKIDEDEDLFEKLTRHEELSDRASYN